MSSPHNLFGPFTHLIQNTVRIRCSRSYREQVTLDPSTVVVAVKDGESSLGVIAAVHRALRTSDFGRQQKTFRGGNGEKMMSSCLTIDNPWFL